MWVKSHRDLEVYKRAFDLAARVLFLTKSFPKEETYSLTDQVRRSSRSVCANIAEAWAKRRYAAVFVNKLTDANAELLETTTWLDFAATCNYVEATLADQLNSEFLALSNSLVSMIDHAPEWCQVLAPKSRQALTTGDN